MCVIVLCCANSCASSSVEGADGCGEGAVGSGGGADGF